MGFSNQHCKNGHGRRIIALTVVFLKMEKSIVLVYIMHDSTCSPADAHHGRRGHALQMEVGSLHSEVGTSAGQRHQMESGRWLPGPTSSICSSAYNPRLSRQPEKSILFPGSPPVGELG